MSEEFKYLLSKMCSYVGASIDDIDLENDRWYEQYEWTEEQQENFYEWLVDEIKNNNEIRKNFFKLNYKPRKLLRYKLAISFIMMWGWKLKQKQK